MHLLKEPQPMQLSQNSKIEVRPALQNLESQIQRAASSPIQYLTELARPFISVLKGIRFEGLFGSRESSNDLVSKESKRLAYEIKQTLGIKGFVLNLTGSASLAAGLPACWDAVRPCLETPELEDAAAQILEHASLLAEDLGASAPQPLHLSQAEASHLQAGLDFYHFFLPKMLVLTSALRLACDQELVERGNNKPHAPEAKAGVEDGLHGLFKNIRKILSLSQVKGPAQMPRVWTNYLAAASVQLQPIVQGENYNRAQNQLHEISRQLAPGFQVWINATGLDNLEAIAKQVSRLETLLPSLVVSITLLELYFRPADMLNSGRSAPAQPVSQSEPRNRVGARVDASTGASTAISCPG